jgi:glycosyltransferase involved in cell wall biosynthesis
MGLVSVVIACYNHGRFLPAAVDSVLAQDYGEIELIVVDDGSTDETPDVAARYPVIRYLRQENQGAAAAKRAGLEASTGQFLMFLDADDTLLPGAIGSLVRGLQERPECAYSYGHQQFVDVAGALITSRPQRAQRYQTCIDEDPYRHMLRTNHPLRVSGAVCYRTELVKRAGGFATDLAGAEDLDINLRLAREHPICCSDQIVLSYRIHAANSSGRFVPMLRAAIKTQRRQHAFVKENPGYEHDYRHGLRLAQAYWGTKVAHEALARARSGEMRTALADLAVLGRYAPRAGAAALVRLALGRGTAEAG